MKAICFIELKYENKHKKNAAKYIIGFSFDEESVSTISNAVETYHRIIESFKFGFSIRSLFGDPDIEIKEFKDNLGIVSILY